VRLLDLAANSGTTVRGTGEADRYMEEHRDQPRSTLATMRASEFYEDLMGEVAGIEGSGL
jgi:hypothetical protein